MSHATVDTSIEAMQRVAPFAQANAERVYAYLKEVGGATQEETAEALGMGRPTACSRFWTLEREGRIRKTDEKRPTHSGCNARVYVVVQ